MNHRVDDAELRVLLVDDQALIGEAVRRMLAPEADIRFRYCNDPAQAIPLAKAWRPTVILQDLVMPEIDGLTLVKYYRAEPALRDTPLIVLSAREEAVTKAEAFAAGAHDYLVKLPDRIELVARLRHHSQGFIARQQRNEAYRALEASQKALAAELAEAAAYVQSLLPAPLDAGSVRAAWRFVPSTSLGGDAFGYHWLDDDHFCMFLLDVCGHGVGAALLSISAMDALRSRTLPNTDFRDPSATLSALNEAFPMERHNNMFFTIWYGVYQPASRTVRFASAGHPPGVLLARGADAGVRLLRAPGLVLGALPGTRYRAESAKVPPGAVLVLLSDGAYEIAKPDGSMWSFDEFKAFVASAEAAGKPLIEDVLTAARALHGPGPLDDDFSLIRFEFPA